MGLSENSIVPRGMGTRELLSGHLIIKYGMTCNGTTTGKRGVKSARASQKPVFSTPETFIQNTPASGRTLRRVRHLPAMFPFEFCRRRFHFQAVRIISSISAKHGFHPNPVTACKASSIWPSGAPSRCGPSSMEILRPVTRRAQSTISRTEEPVPFPKFNAVL